MQNFITLCNKPFWVNEQRAQKKEEGEKAREIMPSIMATSLARWRTHSAQTNIFHY